MEITLSQSRRWQVATVMLGCGLLAICSHIKIPFYPVPFTLQTFAIFILGLTQTPKQAALSTLSYLLCATLGLPVLSASADSLWYMGKTGGYLLAFPVAAWLIAKLNYTPWLAVLCGQLVIYLIGVPWLIPFVGVKIALTHGVAVFIGPSILKAVSAVYLTSKWKEE